MTKRRALWVFLISVVILIGVDLADLIFQIEYTRGAAIGSLAGAAMMVAPTAIHSKKTAVLLGGSLMFLQILFLVFTSR